MMRLRPITNIKAALSYHSRSDGGYYLGGDGMRWAGKGAAQLGLEGTPTYEQFERLLKGLDPHTGGQLTAKLIDNRLAGWEATVSLPKGVTVAHLLGDERVRGAQWEAVNEAIADLQDYVTTRVRKGGVEDDRRTGNLIALVVPHHETRPAKADGMPDPDDHFHVILFNVTYDPVEHEWKAIKFRPIMDLRKWFDRRLDLRMAGKLSELGYEIETKYKSDGPGGQRYFSWDIKGMPETLISTFSRRTQEVDEAEKTVIKAINKKIEEKNREEGTNEPLLEQLSPTARDKLGATSRLHKRDDMTLEDYRDYWHSRVSPEEARQVAAVIQAAREGRNPRPQNTVAKAAAYAIAHEFERRSVVRQTDLEITAMERCLGAARPEDILPELQNQGVLRKDGQVTTKAVRAEETKIIDFASEGRGTRHPLSPGLSAIAAKKLGLSDEQAVLVNHVLRSTDRIVLVVGDAGTGKTRSVRAAFEQIRCPVEMLAPSADASRGVLRAEGFAHADTVASFLMSEERQAAVRNGVLWVDEAGLLPIRDLSQLVEIAREQNARIVLQGDPKQHRSVVRHGNMLHVLQEYAGLPVGRLSEIWRQQHSGYKAIVAGIAGGQRANAFDQLAALGWVQQTDSHQPLVEDYLAGLDAGKSMLVVAPTHLEGQEINAVLRQALKERGTIGSEERVFDRLIPLHWTGAEKADVAGRYDGTEVLQFHRNSGTFKAGQRIDVAEWKTGDRFKSPEHFSVYAKGTIGLAAGDVIRTTATIKDTAGRRIDNGSYLTVTGFSGKGIGVKTASGQERILPANVGHISHGYVATSHAAQGRTVDRVLIAMGGASLGAINAEQFYVSLSRGRESAKVYSDLAADELKRAIERSDPRKSATELLGVPVAKRQQQRKDHPRPFAQRMRARYRILRGRERDGITEPARQPERGAYELAR